MSQQTRTYLKDKFKQGAKPTGADFADLIDSTPNLSDGGDPLSNHIDGADEEKHGANQVAGLIPTTNIAPTPALKFDKNYWPDETRQFDLSSGNITLSLDSGVTNIVGFCNFFDVVADGVHSINLGAGFKSNGIFPSTLDGTILEAGTYMFFCIYSANGIVVNVPALGGSGEVVADTPPYATNVYFTGQPVVGEQMSIWHTYNDDEGDIESGTTYKWYRADDISGTNRVAISGATFKNYIVQASDEGKKIQGGVTVANSKATGTEVLTAYSRTVQLTDTFAPEVQSASVSNNAPARVVLVFDEIVTFTVNGFTVNRDAASVQINDVLGSGTNTLEILLDSFIQLGDVVTLSYNSATSDVVDLNSNILVSFTDRSVINNVLSDVVGGVPYSSDLVAFYSYENVELDDISGNITKINNPISAIFDLEGSANDSIRPQLDIANKRILLNGKKIIGGKAYQYSDDGTFTIVFFIEMNDNNPNDLNRTLLQNINYRTLNFRTFYQGYLLNALTGFVQNYYGFGFGRHAVSFVSTGTNVSVYLDDITTPMFTSDAALTELIVSNLFTTYAGVSDLALNSEFKAFSELLVYSRALSEVERSLVVRDYLGNKYGCDVGNRPVVTAFGLTNVSNGGTVNNGANVTFDFTLSDARDISRIIIIQTTNAAYIANTTTYLILEDGALREFILSVPPFIAQSNNEFGIIVIDALGRVSTLFVDTTINFTITNV